MRSYHATCFIVILAICGFTVGCGGGDSPAPVDNSTPSVSDAPADGAAAPAGSDSKPGGSDSK